MQTTVHRADSRGRGEYSWLSTRYTFSFAEYRNPERVRFGLLRVINDDMIAPSMGFGTHPHENMEIISIPLSGELRHDDSLGNTHFIRAGEVQLMSAGTGLTHSEFNASAEEPVNLLQIWVFPKRRDIDPRYDQRVFEAAGRHNRLQNIVSPDPVQGGVVINQDAWFWRGDFSAGHAERYALQARGNGVYVFVIEGEAEVAGERLQRRDGIGITDVSQIELNAITNTQLLIMEVPQ